MRFILEVNEDDLLTMAGPGDMRLDDLLSAKIEVALKCSVSVSKVDE
jgi:hypothetical protein